ncbi:hypothetical protein D9615_006866 [Tricholomella constricta]|uniref:Uncharacterized protein n=1 Tax=Tricholomella constricta TaxID=117010 RepID=A0A8H5M2G3_9AGAR|nr:hypothetical protein D9615_006866 [Tricholomella constricta]
MQDSSIRRFAVPVDVTDLPFEAAHGFVERRSGGYGYWTTCFEGLDGEDSRKADDGAEFDIMGRKKGDQRKPQESRGN